MGRCSDLKGSAVRSVVLGIRLAHATAKNRDEIAEAALKRPEVLEAIHKEFRKHAAALLKANLAGEALGGTAARSFLGAVGKAAQPEAVKQVKKQKSYKEAVAGLEKLKCSFEATPVGVFVDRHKKWLIVAGVVVGVGSVAAMYKTRSGDLPAKAMAAITKLAAKKIEIGDVDFSVKDLDFKPSKGDATARVGVTMGPLEKAHATFDVKAVVKGGKLETLMASDSLVVPLTERTKFTAQASAGLRENLPAYGVAAVLSHKRKRLTVNLRAFADVKGTGLVTGIKGTAGYKANVERYLGKGARATVGATGLIQASRPSASEPFATSASLNLGVEVTFW